jgi:phage baseplate assembly protein V
MDARQLKKMIASALGSVRQALRGRLQRATGGKQVILVQADGLAGEQFNDAEFFQHPGLRSLPLAGMQAIMIPLGGRSANGVVVAMSNGALFITDLQPGEVALFNENDGVANSIILRNGKVVDITCETLNINASAAVNIHAPVVTLDTTTTTIGATTVSIDAPTTTASGNLNVAQTVAGAADVTAAGKSLKAHVHDKVATGFAVSGKNQ